MLVAFIEKILQLGVLLHCKLVESTMKQRGSALIIAMMLIATVGAAAFGVARLLYVDTSISTTYENGALAYYAAESGMEEGFLRYKYNMNAELPYANPNDVVVANRRYWTFNDSQNKVFRTNLFSNTVDTNVLGQTYNEGIPSATDVTTPDKQLYDLRMGYLGTYDNTTKTYRPWFYHNSDSRTTANIQTADILNTNFGTGDNYFLHLPQDESRKFDLSNVNLSLSNPLIIGFKFIGVKSGAQFTRDKECKAMAEVKFLVNGGTPTAKEYKALTSFNPGTCAGIVGIEAGKLDEASGYTTGGYTSITGTGIYDPNATPDIGYFYSMYDILTQTANKAGVTISSSDKVVMTIKPLYYDADIFFMTASCYINETCISDRTNIVPGPFSYITSTGYYGGVTRTLKANIDRQSGTLYDLYDYVLFKGN